MSEVIGGDLQIIVALSFDGTLTAVCYQKWIKMVDSDQEKNEDSTWFNMI